MPADLLGLTNSCTRSPGLGSTEEVRGSLPEIEPSGLGSSSRPTAQTLSSSLQRVGRDDGGGKTKIKG